MDRVVEVVVPWEHWVCSQCLRDNPYAVWLIKLRCFQPKKHYCRQILVSIEPSLMKLVEMRDPPSDIEQQSSSIPPCSSECCLRRDSCPLPHSEVEYNTWEFIRTAIKGENHLLPDSLANKIIFMCYNRFHYNIFIITMNKT